MKTKIALAALVYVGMSSTLVFADGGKSELIGPMFQPVEIENPNALKDAKVDSLQGRNLTDGIVGPAMLPTEAEEETKSSAKSGKKKNSRSSYGRFR